MQPLSVAMNAREPRFRVMLPARVRWGSGWVTGSVRNVSEHGLMVCMGEPPPPPGTYVELLVGAETITARSVWADQPNCGLRTRGAINFDGLREPASRSGRSAALAEFGSAVRHEIAKPERRTNPEHARHLSYAMQYLTALIVGALVAASIGWEVYQTLSAPMSSVSRAMAGDK